MKNDLLKFTTFLLAIILVNCQEQEADTLPAPSLNNFINSTTVKINDAACQKILIDASRDGGVWWYPQENSFKASENHQGKMFADALRERGFVVNELPRGASITEDVLKNYPVIIRTGGYGSYTQNELEAYKMALDKGITFFLLSDHHKFEYFDGLAEAMGVKFGGIVGGTVSKFTDHVMVKGMSNVEYMVGSIITNVAQNQDIKVIGSLTDGSPVMAILNHPKSNVFLMGDVSTIEFSHSQFDNNIVSWVEMNCGRY